MKKQKNETSLKIIISYIALQGLIMFLQLATIAIVTNQKNYLQVNNWIIVICFGVFTLLIYKLILKTPLKYKRITLKIFLKSLGLVAAFTIFEVIFCLLVGGGGIFTNSKPTIRWLASCFFIPITEEVVFRKALNNLFLCYINTTLAGFITSFLFAFVHMNFSWLFLLNFVFGEYLQLIYNKEKNLVYPVLIHIGINLIALI